MDGSERTLRGYGVSPGIVEGTLVHVGVAPGIDPLEARPTDPELAYQEVETALDEVAADLERRAAAARKGTGSLIEAAVMMARDSGLRQAVLSSLRAGAGRTRAIAEATSQFTLQLEALGGYMAERKSDLEDIRNRTIAKLRGLPQPGIPVLEEPAILVGADISPAEASSLDPATCLGILMSEGGPTGHMSILAAQLGIPAVVQVKGIEDALGGTRVLFDGERGEVIVDPQPERIEQWHERGARRAELIGKARGPGRTRDGHPVALMANIGTVAGAISAAEAGVEGVGLFRTEFLYLDREEPPTAGEQVCTYRRVLAEFPGRPVVIRTLDVGADKPLPFLAQHPEGNPALGRRGIRLSMSREGLLDEQLGAIAAAAAETSAAVQVMAPMIATVQEAAWFTQKAAEFSLPSAGIMVEVPAAAVTSGLLCSETDFVSVGTNDLSQYAMGADRLEGDFAELLDPWQPALLELVRLTSEGAKAKGKPVGVCGEAAGDPVLALVFAGLGASNLSMLPALIPGVRAALALHTLGQCEQFAKVALAAGSPQAARQAVLDLAAPELGDII